MNPFAIAAGIVGGRLRSRGKLAFGVTAALTGFRVFRRITRASSKPVLTFAVKPGEVYEIRGNRRRGQ